MTFPPILILPIEGGELEGGKMNYYGSIIFRSNPLIMLSIGFLFVFLPVDQIKFTATR